jgi:SAM-dependent MidA family methyltransferase
MSPLEAIIHAEILGLGSIRFDRFMDLALNHPLYGYYTRETERPRTGREGDFFTSVSVGPMFGRLLARQFFRMWQVLGKPAPFWIIEQGAHDGQLACDILKWCRDETPEFFEAVQYAIVEPSASMRGFQQKKMEEAGFLKQAAWFRDVGVLADEQPVGVFFSNELVDALPVRLITRKKGEWWELQVTLGAETSFAWLDRPIDDRELADAVRALPLPAIEDYTTEMNLRARDWMEDVGRAMKRGYVVTIDYGFPASIYYADFRVGGTLTAYLQHRRTEEILLQPGSRDITAHVDFTALSQAGKRAGLATLGFVDQQRFFMGVAHDEFSGAEGPRVPVAENLRAWNTLTHPEHLGSRFQVLLQAKDAPASLDGLRFARPGGL